MSDFCMELVGATDVTETQSSVSEVREEQRNLHASRDIICRAEQGSERTYIFHYLSFTALGIWIYFVFSFLA